MDKEYVYHYTAMVRWLKIQESGYLKLTPSNLLKPVNPHFEIQDGVRVFADETDSYKPVVWLTNLDDPTQHGLDLLKQQIQIAIPYDKKKHIWWVEWKDKNRMKSSWFKRLTSNNERYGSWYVSEEIIPLADVDWVKDRLTGEIIYKKEE